MEDPEIVCEGRRDFENYCTLCQEPKSVVGHTSLTCPMTKCLKCGRKGHSVKNCRKSTSKTSEKHKISEGKSEQTSKKCAFNKNNVRWNQEKEDLVFKAITAVPESLKFYNRLEIGVEFIMDLESDGA